ncbi:hypothetical protein C8250_006000 [Streptomyces sp. So13.3]|uniref:PASTA domain-containing protein n=1 Tax=Streptomyces TaxID=1883 RepID=UPI001105B5FD|nr:MULTISPECIES: hypothetical protein [unclassified Streptomyces]MCZ4098752.1 hypothetical protein [Streptomyces sp. H39-C1]QNA71518.1 hypothetical protein C8250_006000 [Streptomyces sp. So13.3]
MRIRTIAVTAAVIISTAALSACDPKATAPAGAPAPSGAASVPSASAASSAAAPAKTATVPVFIGMGLQSAQDAAQAAGFAGLTSHDALGRARHQILDRDWRVCSQNHAAGKSIPVDTTLDFGAVKLEEKCPGTDRTPPKEAGATMPDFVGKSVKAAHQALPSNASVDSKDATQGRLIIIESNWQVCTQTPAAGAALNGQPVMFTAVKFGESCP